MVLQQAEFERGRTAVIVPLQLALANALTVAAGMLVFAEHITPLSGAGIALMVVGTGMLQLKPSSAPVHPA